VNVEQFCSASRVVIVAGKGGVGKTTVTAALATAAARAKASVLIVEVEGKSGLSAALGCPPLTYEEHPVADRLRARTLTPDEALLEYLEERGLRRISRRLVRSGALDVVATAVPGMKDILVLGKVKQLERGGAADLIVIDAPAAGHAVSFLLSARGLLDAVRVGPVRTQAEEVIALLSDPARCRVILVTLAEETPVNELVETAFALEDRVGVKLGPVVVNAVPERLEFTGRAVDDAAAAGLAVSSSVADSLDAAASFRAERRALALAQADRLARRLPLPQLRLPFVFGEIGPRQVGDLAEALTDGVGALPDPT
jgi:anion-transporting  ArsA/GET3 family ATPase